MGDEIQKRNTDCVYFLASPLTCKKGFECEYRHSDSARLNPRDCWYWLAGNCLNPTCAFRHPPLDGDPETSLESTSLPHQASVPMSKTTVPCYFYFHSFCNKGDSCSFLHGPNGVTPTRKSSKTAFTITNAYPLEHRILTGSDGLQASIKAPPNPTETTLKAVENVQFQSEVHLQESVPDNVVKQRTPLSHISMPGCEEAVLNSETLLATEDFIDGGSVLCANQSSEEKIDGHMESEERWESSPGFDVLVNNGSENLRQGHDPKYLLAREGEAKGLQDHLFQYDYEDSVGYNPTEYSDAGILYEHGIYDSYNHVENDRISDYVQKVPKRLRETTLDPILPQKRKLFGRVNDRNGVDLRDHLRNHKRIDGRQASHNPRKRHGSSHLNDNSQKQARRHGRNYPFRGRLAWEVGKNMIRPQSENDMRSTDSHQCRWLRHLQPRHNRSRQHEKEIQRQARPHFIASVISRGTVSSETRSTQESTAFTGPKTLAQIKEEKRKARANEDGFESSTHCSRTASDDFDEPKLPREILRDARLCLISDNSMNQSSKHYHTGPATNCAHSDNDVVIEDEDNEDEEGFEKKLASILS